MECTSKTSSGLIFYFFIFFHPFYVVTSHPLDVLDVVVVSYLLFSKALRNKVLEVGFLIFASAPKFLTHKFLTNVMAAQDLRWR